jgi:hypothetical protein
MTPSATMRESSNQTIQGGFSPDPR